MRPSKSRMNNQEAAHKCQRGVVIILAALTVMTVITLIGLALEIGARSATETKLEDAAKATVLAALQSYLKFGCAESTPALQCESQKRMKALERAQTVLRIHWRQAYSVLVGALNSADPGIVLANVGSVPDGSGALLLLGRYETQDPCPGESCSKCYVPGGPPCFLPISEGNTDASLAVNAAKIHIRLPSASGITQFISPPLAPKRPPLVISKIAAISPMQIMSLVDLSRSSYAESHYPIEAARAQAAQGVPLASMNPSEFAFTFLGAYPDSSSGVQCTRPSGPVCDNLDVDNFGPNHCLITDTQPYCTLGSGMGSNIFCPLIDGVLLNNVQRWGEGGFIYNSLLPNASSGDPLELRVREDYQCTTLAVVSQCQNYISTRSCVDTCRNSTDWYQCLIENRQANRPCGTPLCTPDTRTLLVDSHYPRAPQELLGPRPLYTFLEGIQTITSIFRQRAMSGDMLGVVGFDQSTDNPYRIFPLSSPNTDIFRRLEKMVKVRETDVASGSILPTAVDEPNYRSQLRLLKEHLFFPFGWSNSNGSLAAMFAMNMFMDTPNRAQGSSLAIIMFSDGIFNCVNPLVNGIRQTRCNTSIYDSGNSASPSYVSARNEFKNFLTQTLRPNNVRFHLFLSGMVQPHTLVYRDSNSNCIFEPEDARRFGLAWNNFVDPRDPPSDPGRNQRAYHPLDPNNPFLQPAELAEEVFATDGFFVPLRPACVPGVDISESLRRACNSRSSPGRVFETGQNVPVSDLTNNQSHNGEAIIDGRLVCDPRGRNATEQVDFYINSILNENTVRLVR